MPSQPFDCEITLCGSRVRAAGKWWPGKPAQTSGPPESCYEEQPADVSCTSLTLVNPEELVELLVAFGELSSKSALNPEEIIDTLLISALEERQAELDALDDPRWDERDAP